MPYIKESERQRVLRFGPKTAGELNYMLTEICRVYVETVGSNYQAINDVLGGLEGAKLEFYRRHAAPYEDKKIAENGDVY